MLLECGDLALVTPTDKISDLQPFRLVFKEQERDREALGAGMAAGQAIQEPEGC